MKVLSIPLRKLFANPPKKRKPSRKKWPRRKKNRSLPLPKPRESKCCDFRRRRKRTYLPASLKDRKWSSKLASRTELSKLVMRISTM